MRPIAPGNVTESFAPLGPEIFRGLFSFLGRSVRSLADQPHARLDSTCESGIRIYDGIWRFPCHVQPVSPKLGIMIWHPFLGLSNETLGWIFAICAVAAILLYFRIETTGRRLRGSHSPLGIVSLSLSHSLDESREILKGWDTEGRDAARRLLLLDLWFAPLFATAMAVLGIFAAHWFQGQNQTTLAQIAVILAWGQWMAGLLDYAENLSLLRILHAFPLIPESLVGFVGWFARCKFVLVLLAILMCAFAMISYFSVSSERVVSMRHDRAWPSGIVEPAR